MLSSTQTPDDKQWERIGLRASLQTYTPTCDTDHLLFRRLRATVSSHTAVWLIISWQCYIFHLLIISYCFFLFIPNSVANANTIQRSSFVALKTISGNAVYTVDVNPLKSFFANSNIVCVGECAKRPSPTKCVGVNYWKANMLCDVFDNNRTMLGAQNGCQYYSVSIRSLN